MIGYVTAVTVAGTQGASARNEAVAGRTIREVSLEKGPDATLDLRTMARGSKT